jgi:hypothetical protein
MNVVASTKRYVCSERWRLRLFEGIADETRRVAAVLREPELSAQGSWSDDEFRRRVAAYDDLLAGLLHAEALMGRWSTETMRDSLMLAPKRLCDGAGEGGGNTGLLALQWYPSLLLSYAGGIAAVSSESYGSLVALMHARVSTRHGNARLVEAATSGLGDLRQQFKLLPGRERHYVPFSEYVRARLKPVLDQALYLGADYDHAFDRFEVLYAVEFSHQTGRGWGPMGRFGYMFGRGDANPLGQLIADAESAGAAWPPLVAGVCGGSLEKFLECAKLLGAAASRIGW